MNNVFHSRIVLCRIPCSNSAVRTTEPWVQPSSLSSTSINPLFALTLVQYISQFIHLLCNCTLEGILSKAQCANLSVSQVLSAPDVFLQHYECIVFDKMSLEVHLQQGLSAIVQYSPIYPKLVKSEKRSSEFCETEDSAVVFQCSYTYSRGIKEFTCKLTLDPNLLSIFTTAII